MKYNRMLCWVNENIKAELMKYSDQYHIICTDDYEIFKKQITDDTYLAISLLFSHNNLKFLEELLQKYPNHKFHVIFDYVFCDRLSFSNEVLETFTLADRRFDHYSVELLIEDFCKKNGKEK